MNTSAATQKLMTLESRDPKHADAWMREFQPWGSARNQNTLASDETWLIQRYGKENVRWVEAA